MRFGEFTRLVRSDLYRYTGKVTLPLFLRNVFLRPSFKFTFLLRACRYMRGKWIWLPFYLPTRLALRHYTFRYGISIPVTTDIGPGFYVGHFGGIVINREAKIGKNCNISQGVTIGMVNRGKRAGCPVIGDRVYLGPGSKVIGKVTIGDDAAIGANCVVVKDVAESGVVVGVPAKLLSLDGSAGYVNRTWADPDNRG